MKKIIFIIICLIMSVPCCAQNWAAHAKKSTTPSTVVKKATNVTPKKSTLPTTPKTNVAKVDPLEALSFPTEVEESKKEEPKDDGRNSDYYYLDADEAPQFPGGVVALLKWVHERINIAEEDNYGTFVIYCKISKTGEVTGIEFPREDENGHFQLQKSLAYMPPLLEEGARVCKLLPKFSPGLINGQPANVYYRIPISPHLVKPKD